MPLTLRDGLFGKRRVVAADVAGVIAKIDRPDKKDVAFFDSLVKYCDVTGVDAAILIAQHLVETANQTSPRWNNDLNPGGIGIPADSTVQPFKIATADEAAAIMVQCVYAMSTKELSPKITTPAASRDWFAKVWLPKVNAKQFPRVERIDDLDERYIDAKGEPQATWAWDGTDDGDPSYADKVVARGNAFMPGLPGFVSGTAGVGGSAPAGVPVFGRVEHPYFLDHPITKRDGQGQDNLGRRDVLAVVLHRMLGSLYGTEGHFKRPDVYALTDYGVGVLHQDGAANDGLIIRWNDPFGYQSGWASGPVNGAYGDGEKFVDKYGINAPNRYGCSIEISGLYYSTPFSAAARRSVARLIAHLADRQKIPWDVFPHNPHTGLSFVLHHQQFTIGTGKVCSGDEVMAASSELIAMAREIMRDAQIGDQQQPPAPPPSTTYRKPTTYPWMSPDHPDFGQDHWEGSTEFIYLPVDVKAHSQTQRYATTGPNAALAGPDIEPGLAFHSDWAMRSHNVSYRLTRNGVRVRSAALWPRDNITTKGTVTRYDGPDAEGVIVRRRPAEE